ncbi:uncharacterized protein J7T54_005547 [Emericellopsis cladophorae]|uniref:Uncharacterized protein n=1 Tax=Emericellopsis cladophorae TaxID=2686198 RepID=A0A9P9Y5M0_9HYPO|nr:uncharacterized protein J7T54_005547 [Emericellopsis cladophorae]KAI6783518.1 hypothetical protein J7T54_005547 [Emericellopsis cladophorae]
MDCLAAQLVGDMQPMANWLTLSYKQHGGEFDQAWRTFNADERLQIYKTSFEDCENELPGPYKLLWRHAPLWPDLGPEAIVRGTPETLINVFRHRTSTTLEQQRLQRAATGAKSDLELVQEIPEMDGIESGIQVLSGVIGDPPGAAPGLLSGNIRTACHGMFANAKSKSGFVAETVVYMRQAVLFTWLYLIWRRVLPDRELQRSEPPDLPLALRRVIGDPSEAKGLNVLVDLNESFEDFRASLKSVKRDSTQLKCLVDMAAEQASYNRQHCYFIRCDPKALFTIAGFYTKSKAGAVSGNEASSHGVNLHNDYTVGVLEALQRAAKVDAAWTYILELLSDLRRDMPRTYRTQLLQELANMCDLAFRADKALVTRFFQTGLGRAWFERVSDVPDSFGNYRHRMVGDPRAELSPNDSRLWLLNACETGADAYHVAYWTRKFFAPPAEGTPTGSSRLSDLPSPLCALVQHLYVSSRLDILLRSYIPMPSPSRKKGLLFLSRFYELETEFVALEAKVSKMAFARPSYRLNKPEVAKQAINTIEGLYTDKYGSSLDDVYFDLVEDCLSSLTTAHWDALAGSKPAAPNKIDIRVQGERGKLSQKASQEDEYCLQELHREKHHETEVECSAKHMNKPPQSEQPTSLPSKTAAQPVPATEPESKKGPFIPWPGIDEPTRAFDTSPRREKKKTRPVQSTLPAPNSAEIKPAKRELDTANDIKPESTPCVKIRVSATTAKTFTDIFCKSVHRPSVSWSAFEAAMTELGFSVIPNGGSILAFIPPESMGLVRAFIAHRPHKAHMEGRKTLRVAKDLQRRYGWTEETFNVQQSVG